jgi:hypothetical protein
MNKRILLVGVVGLLMALLLAGIAGAQTSPGYNLSWYVLAGGGGRSAAAHYAMNSTVGQALVGFSDSASYGMRSGYWQNWPDYHVFLPVVVKGV